MNIDPMSLIPKTIKDFQNETGNDTVAAARYNYYANKRHQALAVLQMRYKDFENGNQFVGRMKYE